ncbi:hypothetical protein VTK26DRAFT_6615 [Humicola hyalothermophila]
MARVAANVQQYLCLSSLHATHQHAPSAPYKAETSIDFSALAKLAGGIATALLADEMGLGKTATSLAVAVVSHRLRTLADHVSQHPGQHLAPDDERTECQSGTYTTGSNAPARRAAGPSGSLANLSHGPTVRDQKDNESELRAPPNSPANLDGGPDKVPAEPANTALNPAGGSGGDNCSDQGPSSGSPAEDKTASDTKELPPDSASGNGEYNSGLQT